MFLLQFDYCMCILKQFNREGENCVKPNGREYEGIVFEPVSSETKRMEGKEFSYRSLIGMEAWHILVQTEDLISRCHWDLSAGFSKVRKLRIG